MALARRLLILVALVACACVGPSRRIHRVEHKDGTVTEEVTEYCLSYSYYTGWTYGYCGYGPPALYDNRYRCYRSHWGFYPRRCR